MSTTAGVVTASVLGAIGGLHIAWGLGSSFPAGDPEWLADTVAGTNTVPEPVACFAVGGVLLVASGLVAGVLPVPPIVRRAGVIGVAGVLTGRGLAGLAGRTERLVGWTPSPRFVRLDRRFYAPLCLTLAAGALASCGTGSRSDRRPT
jgi:hypothetical protein